MSDFFYNQYNSSRTSRTIHSLSDNRFREVEKEKVPDSVKRKEVVVDRTSIIKIKQIISDYTNGNITLEETLRRLSEPPLSIKPICNECGDITIYTFNYGDKTYIIQEVKSKQEPPIDEPDDVDEDDKIPEEPETPAVVLAPEIPQDPEVDDEPDDDGEGNEPDDVDEGDEILDEPEAPAVVPAPEMPQNPEVDDEPDDAGESDDTNDVDEGDEPANNNGGVDPMFSPVIDGGNINSSGIPEGSAIDGGNIIPPGVPGNPTLPDARLNEKIEVFAGDDLIVATIEIWTLEELKEVLDDATIDIYFKRVGLSYKIKDEYKNKFSKLEDVVNYKNTVAKLQNQLILTNFVNGLNRKENSASSLLYNDVTNNVLTVNNYEEVLASIALLSEEELAELKQQAVEKFIRDFSTGNLAYVQAKLVLNAIGVENLSMKLENIIYTISFTFNNQSYSVSCEQKAADKGNDDRQQTNFSEAYINSFRFMGATDEVINQYFYETSDANGEKTYALIPGKEMLAFYVEAGIKIALSEAEVNGLNIGLDTKVFNEIVEAFFEKTVIYGKEVYVLNASSIDVVKNTITETYVSSKINSTPNFVPSTPDQYGGYVLIDNDTLEDRKANYYYMCYMNGLDITGTEFEDGMYDKELAIACGIYPTGDIFGEYMKDAEVREYLKTTFGIDIPDPSNTDVFNEFVNTNRELWNKLADLTAIDSNGYYTGEYNKQNVLKFFGLAMTDGIVLDYAESLTYESKIRNTGVSNDPILSCDSDYTLVKDYLSELYPELFEQGILNDDLCKKLGKIAKMFILYNKGITDLDDGIVIKKCLQAQAELIFEANILGFDTEWFINSFLASKMDFLCQLPNDIAMPSLAPRRSEENNNSDIPSIPQKMLDLLKEQFGEFTINKRSIGFDVKDGKGNVIGVLYATDDQFELTINNNDNLESVSKYFFDNGKCTVYDKEYYIMGFIESVTERDWSKTDAEFDAIRKEKLKEISKNDEFCIKLLEYIEENSNRKSVIEFQNILLENKISTQDLLYDLCKKRGYTDFIKLLDYAKEQTDNKDLLSYILNITKNRIESETTQGINKTNFQWNADGQLFNIPTMQGNEGNCWLLSLLNSASRSEAFNHLINEIVKINNDNKTYTVNLHNKEYTFTFDEVFNAKELSNGDYDVRAFELAFRQSLAELGRNINGGSLISLLEGFMGFEITKEIFENTGCTMTKEITDEVMQQIYSGNYVATTGKKSDYRDEDIYVKDMDGNDVELFSAHAYSIIGADNEYVYIQNPHDIKHGDNPSYLKMKIEDFKKYMDYSGIKIETLIDVIRDPEKYKPAKNNNNNFQSCHGTQPTYTHDPVTNTIIINGIIPNPSGGNYRGNAFNGSSTGSGGGSSNDIKIDSALQQLLSSLLQQGISASGLNWSQDSSGNIIYTVNVYNQTYNGQSLQNSMPNFLEDFNKKIQEGFKQYYGRTNVGQYIESYKTGGKYSTWTFDELISAIQNNTFYDYNKGTFDIDEFTRALEDIGMNNYNTLSDIRYGKNDTYIIYVTRNDGSVTKVEISSTLSGITADVMTLSADDINDYLSLNNPGENNNPVNIIDFLPPGLREAFTKSITGIDDAAIDAKARAFFSMLQNRDLFRANLPKLADTLKLADYFTYANGDFDPVAFEKFLNENFGIKNDEGKVIGYDYDALAAFANAVRDYAKVKFEESFSEINDLNAWLEDIKTRNRGPNSIMGPGTAAIYWNYVDIISSALASPEDVMNAIRAIEQMKKDAATLGISFSDYLTVDPLRIAQMRARLTHALPDDYYSMATVTYSEDDAVSCGPPNQSGILTAPSWFKYLYKTKGITPDDYGFGYEIDMPEEEAEKMEQEIEHYTIWCNKNSSLVNSLPLSSLYNLYQYDMSKFVLWSIFELPMLEVPDDLSWEELYDLYLEKTGGLNIL